MCDPAGDETITAVRVSVRARTQYEDGVYEVVLGFDAGEESTTFNGTDPTWATLTPAVDSWAAVEALSARVSLADHPGGRRDSDVWVDAFVLEVDFVVPTPEDTAEPAEQVDTGVPPTTDTAVATVDTSPASPEVDGPTTGGSPGAMRSLDDLGCAGGWAWVLFAPVFLACDAPPPPGGGTRRRARDIG